jgi:hypothetical protein
MFTERARSSTEKNEAREWWFDKIANYFGGAIPDGRSMASLCNLQPPTGSELSQALQSGVLMTPGQYCGVDTDSEVISKNRAWWPGVPFYEMDYSTFVATEFSSLDVAAAYIDSTSEAVTSKLITMTVDTMHQCGENCVLCVNVMLNNWRHERKWDSNVFTDALSKKLTRQEHKRWFDKSFVYKVYCGSRTVMAQYFFTSDRSA